jgi:hypothetical protein
MICKKDLGYKAGLTTGGQSQGHFFVEKIDIAERIAWLIHKSAEDGFLQGQVIEEDFAESACAFSAPGEEVGDVEHMTVHAVCGHLQHR